VNSIDPTGTHPISKALAKTMIRSWKTFKKEISRVVGQVDSFGLNPNSIISAQGGQVHVFNTWFDNAQNMVMNKLRNDLEMAISRGYSIGQYHATSRVGQSLQIPLPGPSVLIESAYLDFQGIMAAVLQQATRAFSNFLLNHTPPQKAARALLMTVDKVGAVRSTALAFYAVVRAHAMGTLDTLQALGIERVGTIPEALPKYHKLTGDEKVATDAVIATVRLRTPRPRPSSSQVTRARRVERKLEQALGGEVDVETSGLPNVCPRCKQIAKNGPYTIDQARGLIPAHPSCACIFVPA